MSVKESQKLCALQYVTSEVDRAHYMITFTCMLLHFECAAISLVIPLVDHTIVKII